MQVCGGNDPGYGLLLNCCQEQAAGVSLSLARADWETFATIADCVCVESEPGKSGEIKKFR